MVTHTIKDAGFLDRLLKSARANDVKLTAVVQAAIALTFYDEAKPTEEETCKILSAFDLRTRNMKEPWGQRNKFVGAAVGTELMDISYQLPFSPKREPKHLLTIASGPLLDTFREHGLASRSVRMLQLPINCEGQLRGSSFSMYCKCPAQPGDYYLRYYSH